MNPYYQDELTTIYHGDCAEIAPSLGRFDLLLTDPPYGIGESSRKQKTRGGVVGFKGKIKAKKFIPASDFGFNEWDKMTPPTELIEKLRDQSKHQIIWGGNYFQLPPTSCILVWDKEQSGDFADCELAWTNLKKAVRKFTYRWNGMLQEPGKPKEKRLHPTQKPQALIYWCLDFAPEAKTVLDPFMGSGTTLLCARNRGKTAVGIDKDERYCEIAATRLSQRVLSFET